MTGTALRSTAGPGTAAATHRTADGDGKAGGGGAKWLRGLRGGCGSWRSLGPPPAVSHEAGGGRGGGEGREGEGLCEVMLGGWCPWAAVRGGEGERGCSRCSCCPWDALVAAVCPWETELSRPWQGCAFISSPAGSRV